ncbi:hypothetical protein [Chondromyces crocatus]|uniref:Secreted protein n=1 Tax=Chondromyces crocatus TaxID=52 RepID=A0A0K1EDU1_CHOCO|nr:hypothetical protein [Chondromyces crocatus]AKT38738.1 uncharacterized protein CMC5_028820 [Chondromyces crocatus]
MGRQRSMRGGRWDLSWTSIGLCAMVAVGVSAASGCGGGDEDGSGGSGASTSSQGGAGGAGAGGAGGTGGAGGDSGDCLDPSTYADAFSIVDSTLCAVGVYTADVSLGSVTWGRHGGPLLLEVDNQHGDPAHLVRLSPPAGATGAMTSTVTTIETGTPAGSYFGGQALDLPFFDWTALSWTGAFPNTEGELLLVTNDTVTERYTVNGFYAATALAGRLLYTGLSLLGEGASGANALYAADSCGTADQNPRFLPEGDATCSAPVEVDSWGDFSGPLTIDRAGNAFAILPTFSDGQEARAYAAGQVARGAGATQGTTLFELPGFGDALAAMAPEGDAPGLVVFQPTDPATYDYLDPLATPYTSGATVQPQGEPAEVLRLTTPNTALALTTDEDNRVWVGLTLPGGVTTFVVLARR